MALKIPQEKKEAMLASLSRYVEEEMELEVPGLQLGFLLDFMYQEFAASAYNQGVKDAEQYFRGAVEDLEGTCYEDEMGYWSKKR